jgi:predicted PurR-regulated permease PerM
LADLGGATTLAAVLLTTLAVGGLVFLTSWAAPLLAPLCLGLVLTALATPLFESFVGRGRSATMAMVITVVVVILVGGALVVLSIYSSRQLVASLATYADQINARNPAMAELLASIGVPGAIRGMLSPEALVSIVESAASIVSEVGGNLAFAVVLAALLLLDLPRISRLVGQGVGAENPVFREYPAVARAAVTYFIIRIRVNLITAAGLLVLMLVLGVDDALLWAIGAFFLSFVPYVGLVLAMIPPTILAYAESGPAFALLIVIGAMILNVVAENVLEPSITGEALHLSTWLVFVMFFFTVWLIGSVGALLAMPLTVMIVLVLQENPRTHWVATLLTEVTRPARYRPPRRRSGRRSSDVSPTSGDVKGTPPGYVRDVSQNDCGRLTRGERS